MDRAKRIWYLSPMQAVKVQASLRIRAVSPEPPLLAHTSNESRGTFRQKARFLAPLNGWACEVKICQDGMLEDTNSLDGAHMVINNLLIYLVFYCQCFQTHNQGTVVVINVLFLTSENEISGIIYSLFRGRQNIFLTIFSIKLDVKCATKILKISLQIQKLCPQVFLNTFFFLSLNILS